MGLLTLGPAAPPLGLALGSSLPVKQFRDAVEAIPNGSIVLMFVATTTGRQAGNGPDDPNRAPHLFDKHCRVVITCLWPGGSGLVDETIEKVAAEYRANGHTLVYGKDYVDLGYKPGTRP